MSRVGIEQLLYAMDMAFDAHGYEDSLLRNLRSMPEDSWLWMPPGGSRNVRMIAGHVAACKYMYWDHAFGDGTLTWNDPAGALGASIEEMQSTPDLGAREPSVGATIEWLCEGHRLFRDSVAALDDAELPRLRRPPEGGMHETRWVIAVLSHHDLYHAGEINHIRALRQGDDRWAWEEEGR